MFLSLTFCTCFGRFSWDTEDVKVRREIFKKLLHLHNFLLYDHLERYMKFITNESLPVNSKDLNNNIRDKQEYLIMLYL